MSKAPKEEPNKLGMGKVIDASFQRKRDSVAVKRWYFMIPAEIVEQSDFKNEDQVVCQLVGKEKLVIAKFHLKAPE